MLTCDNEIPLDLIKILYEEGFFMDSRIYKFLVSEIGLTDKELIDCLASKCKMGTFGKRETIIHQNEQPQYVVFLCSGIVRGFLVDEKSNEITDCFCQNFGEAVVPSLPFNAPADFSMQAVVDSEVFMFPVSYVVKLVNSNPAMMSLYNALLQESIKRHFIMKYNLIRFDNTQRYEWFLKEYPGLIDKVSHKYIASFLNMSDVSLSRVRKTLSQRNMT